MGDIYRDLNAGDGDTVAAQGEYILVRSTTAKFHLLIDGQKFSMEAGDKIMVAGGFEEFRIENDVAGAAITLELTVGYGDLTRRTVAGSVTLAKPAGLSDAADVLLTAGGPADLVSAANSAREEIIISNLAANAAVVRIGTSNAAAARGVELSPGQTVVLTTQAAIYAYCAAAQSVSVTEVTT
jgi:hypothetical protein